PHPKAARHASAGLCLAAQTLGSRGSARSTTPVHLNHSHTSPADGDNCASHPDHHTASSAASAASNTDPPAGSATADWHPTPNRSGAAPESTDASSVTPASRPNATPTLPSATLHRAD